MSWEDTIYRRAVKARACRREQDVFDMVEAGKSYSVIAETLGISRDAVAGLLYRRRNRREFVTMDAPPVQGGPVTPGLLKLAPFDPLARRLVEERTAHAPRA